MKIQAIKQTMQKTFTFCLAIALTILLGAVVSQAQGTSVFTTGLNNPAKLITAGQSSLLVAEAGTDAPNTGRISLVNRASGARRTLIDGLPSAVNNDGGAPEASGPSGIKLSGQKLYLTIGAGNTATPATGGFIATPAPSSLLFDSVLELTLPADYESLASGFTLSAADQTTLNSGGQVTLTNAEGKQLTVRLVVNLPNYVAEPRPALPEHIRTSNLYGVEISGDSLYVVDASFNLLYRINIATGAFETFATFASKPNPTQMGPPVVEAVPDSIRLVGNNLLISFLTGFPFVQNFAEVRTVNLDTRAQAVFIPNLTSALDVLPFNGTGDNDSYLVLEFSANMLTRQPGRLKLFTSRSETPRILVDNLITPTSIARDAQTGKIFVTEKATGRILRVNAPRAAYKDYFGTGRSSFELPDSGAPGSNIIWNILRNPVSSAFQIRREAFGLSDSDTPIFDDFDGDLKYDIAVVRDGTTDNAQSYFYYKPSSNSNPNAFVSVPWGLKTDVKGNGDVDGDGKGDFIAVRKESGRLTWYQTLSGSNTYQATAFGLDSDFPVSFGLRDFNGDGRDDLMVVRTSANGDLTFYIGDAQTGNLILAQQWGNENAVPNAPIYLFYGNYIGDSRADLVIYYGANSSNPNCETCGTFWIKETGNNNYKVVKFGNPLQYPTGDGDLPDDSDYDGDGKNDIGVIRNDDEGVTFYFIRSSDSVIASQKLSLYTPSSLTDKQDSPDRLQQPEKSRDIRQLLRQNSTKHDLRQILQRSHTSSRDYKK